MRFGVGLAAHPLDPRLFLGPQQTAPPTVAQAPATAPAASATR
ncbi:hypothetical protein [Bordetella pertussis]